LSQNVLNGSYPKWTRLTDAITQKVEAQAVVYDEKLYVFCGIIDTVLPNGSKRLLPNNSIERYDPTNNTWTSLATLPDVAGLTHYAIALADDRVWLAGGRLNATNQVTDKVWVYNITTNSWTSGPNLPNNLASGAMLKLGRKLHYFAGGTHLPTDRNYLCVLTSYHYVLDLDNESAGWSAGAFTPLPPHIQSIHSSTVQLGGRFYLIGGQYGHDCDTQGAADHDKVFRFDPYLNQWEKMAALPTANSHNEGATFALDGKIYTIAGEITGNQIREYNPDTDTWRIAGYLKNELNKSMKLIGPVAKVIRNKIILANGGLNQSNYQATEKAYIKNFARTSNNALGFLPDTIRQTMQQTDSAKQISAWLWTLNGKAAYSVDLDSLPVWLQITKDSGNITDETATEFKITLRPAQATVGNHYYPLTVTATGYSAATLHIYLNVTNQTLTTPILSPGEVTQTDVGLYWTAADTSTSTISYQILRDGLFLDTTTALNYTATGLTASTTYSFTVAAQDEAGNYSNPSNTMHATTLPIIPNIQSIRINAGGKTQTVNGITWAGCINTTCQVYVSGGKTYTQPGSPFISGVASPLNQAIFQTEWTGGQNTGAAVGQTAFSYHIPLQNGTYLVRLYFAELNKNGAGLRVFDVNIEGGEKELVNFDIFATAGYRTAISREYIFDITDDTLNIDFIRQVDNAKVSAIEVIFQANTPFSAGQTAAKRIAAEEQKNLQAYPNPIAGELLYLSTQAAASGKLHYQLKDMQGRVRLNGNIDLFKDTYSQIPLNLKGLNAGIYLLEVQEAAGNTKVFKIIKQ
jgi:N-acetylneuraminic acid mutarotase/chitodextrinase